MGDLGPLTPLSELDIMSDSDWLDLSSRESEISDLLESDAEDVPSRPRSPHSISSLSERNDEPDRWEGIRDSDEADESSSDCESAGGAPAQFISAGAQATIRARDVVRHRLAEEMRERQALEQSMVSTLSTSRSNTLSASATTSTSRSRDLRLSFPDPLTPSRDELNRSYDNVQMDDAQPPAHLPSPPPPGHGANKHTAVDAAEDPVRAATPEVLQPQSTSQPVPQIDFEVVLYGSQPSDKFLLVESLLEKLAVRSGLLLSKRQPLSARISKYILDVKSKPFASALAVQVIDNIEDAEVVPTSSERPSLAIIYLPHFLTTLPSHDLYLPVVETQRDTSEISDSNEGFCADLLRGGVDRQWDMLRTPTSQALLWHVDTPTTVMSTDEIVALDATEVSLGFEPLLPRRRRFVNVLRAQITSAPAMTLLAVLSIVLGYVMSLSSPVAIPREREIVSPIAKPFINSTYISPMTPPSPTSVTIQKPMALMSAISASLSTIAPSTHERPAAILTPVAVPPIESQAESHAPIILGSTAHCVLPQSLSLKSGSTKSLSVTPSSVKSVIVPHTTVRAVSSHLASTFRDLFSPRIVAAAVRADMKELFDALDELLQVLAANARTTFNMSLGVADNLRDRLRRRHRRAQDRARRLCDKSSQVWVDASKRMSERMEIARKRAKAIQAHFGEEARAVVRRAQQRMKEERPRLLLA